ncbi:glycosyltransferase family 87 protein [Arthrobacter roseus]|uniref:glycosyltransferase family 87 protein n=1 Tax=Arthrobacter roseus TaxID=136274 RepID=UPI0019646647|nr:glycosyltransferase family 87 protein [Arthrobacter roseus]MBM7848812.1 hypothetical protein [Arthrobacter roseus]
MITSQSEPLIFRHRKSTLWGAFVLMHVVSLLTLLPLIVNGQVLSDIRFYREWAYLGLDDGVWQGISNDWVYPVAALLPMLLATVFGSYLYQLGWFALFTALNAVGLTVLTDRGRRKDRYHAAYWWLLATALLGPVALGRIDGLTAPMVIAALLLLGSRPIMAAALLSLATWIKVWPAAVVLVALTVSPKRIRLLLTGFAVSVLITAFVAVNGGIKYLLSFISAQGDRGMQLEAPFTTPGLWQAITGGAGAYIYEDKDINTREVRGALGEPVATLMSPLLFLAVTAVVVLLFWALRRGVEVERLITIGSLAVVSAMIVFNKVGSPQFMLWLVAVTTVGLAIEGGRWKFPGVTMLAISALTTLVYPIFYAELYNELNPWVALLLTLRNGLVVALFVWAVAMLVRLARASSPSRVGQEQAH